MADVIEEKKTYTYADYEKLPEGEAYQLIDGELIMTPSPSYHYQRISGKLEFELRKFVAEKNLGEIIDTPFDVYFSDTETYQPDILFISRDRLHIIKKRKVEGAPDLIIEILSKSTAYYDLKHKKSIYEIYGVKEYWIVDPMDQSIEIYENINNTFHLASRAEKEGQIVSKVIHDFDVDLQNIFA